MEGNRLSKQWRSVGKTDNLAELSQLDEQVILDELKARYDNDIIYTYVGDILIAINPLKPLPIYRTQVSVSYKHAQLLKDPPHIYAVASHVYKQMLSDSSDQCIVISGESGAGKTESTKLVVKQIIEICNGNTQLEQQILQVNPLLEAFGNAKTVINGNSSRFGKYVRLLFHSGKVVGARFSEYLLEKSRVVHQNRGDANFHVFSYMFAGCSDEQKHAYRLKGPHAYKYTRSQAMMAPEASLRNKYEELQNSMDLVGFSEEEQDNLLSILSGVLAIGNIDFTVATNDGEELKVSHTDDLQLAADLLGIHQGDLNDCLTRITNKARGEQILRNFSKHQAKDARDAIAKVIYGRLFSWIVNKINQRLYPQRWASDHQEIGILDIFGFENFTSNNFEQACINLANEHLQFFFNEHIFSLEQDEYKSEGIRWNHISYSDNQPLLDLFLKRPMGILSLLDEESHFPQATDASLVQKLNKNLQSHAGYKAHKSHTGKPQFTIRHYAGEVTYDVINWLEKNRDTVPPTLVTILKHSSIALLSTIFRGTITRTGTLALQNRTRKSLQQRQAPPALPSSTKKFTVGMQFKNSLQELIKNMSEAEPHFIRCLKPNKYQQADRFDDSYVLAQLSYTGMLQTVQIRRDGYSFRPLITDFVSTYQPLLLSGDLPVDRETCKQILRRAEIYDCHIGKTKVFLKYGQDECLADKLNVMVKSVTLLQSVVRGFLARCYVVRRKEVSRQQKEYIQGFMKTMYDRSEKFVRTQQGLLEEEMKIRQEERERAAKEAAKVAAAEAAAAEAAAAEAAKKQAAKEAAAKKQAEVEALARKAKQEAEAKEAAEKLAAEEEAAKKEEEAARKEERKSRQSTDVGVAVLRKKPASNIGGDMAPPRRPAKSERLSAYVESQRLSMTSSGTKSQQEDELMPLPPPVPEPPVATARISRANRGASLRRQFTENRTKSVVERFSQFGDSSTADDEVLEDDFSAYKLIDIQMTAYGPVGLRQTTVEWFRATQLAKLLNPQGNRLYEWFHGIIPRGKAEAQLIVKSVGAFMVRLSEKRLDYVLSFRAENRCRHYRVGITPSNKYVVVGEAKVHRTLFHLVTFHQENSISNWSGLLTEPCGQADPSLPDYLDLLPNNVPPQPSPRTSIQPANTLMQSSSNSNTAVPPPLPPKVNTYRPKAPANYINYK